MKGKKKTKWYYYQTYEPTRGPDEGEVKERHISKKKAEAEDIFDWENISKSRDNPETRKTKYEAWEAGEIGAENIRESAEGYYRTVEWGKLGGRPPKWKKEADRKKAERIRDKLGGGKTLKEKDRAFLATIDPQVAAEILAVAKEGHKGRPREHFADRAASPAERQRARRKRIQEAKESERRAIMKTHRIGCLCSVYDPTAFN